MARKLIGPSPEFMALIDNLQQRENLIKALSSSSRSLHTQIESLALASGGVARLQDQLTKIVASSGVFHIQEIIAAAQPAVPVQSHIQSVAAAALADSPAKRIAEIVAASAPTRVHSIASAVLAASPAYKAAQETATMLAGSPVFRAATLDFAGNALAALIADRAAAFGALPDFARLLCDIPRRPPRPPGSAIREIDEPGVSASGTAADTGSTDPEFVNLAGLTPEQMRLALVWYVYTIVLLTVATIGIENAETAGVVSLIVGGSAHSVAKWCSNLIGKSFDKLYPRQE